MLTSLKKHAANENMRQNGERKKNFILTENSLSKENAYFAIWRCTNQKWEPSVIHFASLAWWCKKGRIGISRFQSTFFLSVRLCKK